MILSVEERWIEELLCNQEILKSQLDKNADINTLLRRKMTSLASSLQLAAEIHETEVSRVCVSAFNYYHFALRPSSIPLLQLISQHGREIAELQFELARKEVDTHKWRQRTLALKVRLGSAMEDAERYRDMSKHLEKQLEIEAVSTQDAQFQKHALQKTCDTYKTHLASARARVAELESAIQTTETRANALSIELNAASSRAQEQISLIQERAKLAEQTAAAAGERALLAEQSLRQREDVAQMTNNLRQATIAAEDSKVQSALAIERRARADAEARALEAEGMAAEFKRDLEKAKRSLVVKEKRIQGLEDSLRLKDLITPARNALEVVGALADDLDPEPPTHLLARNPALMDIPKRRGGGQKHVGGKAKANRKRNITSDDEEDDYVPSPREEDAKPKKRRKAAPKKAAEQIAEIDKDETHSHRTHSAAHEKENDEASAQPSPAKQPLAPSNIVPEALQTAAVVEAAAEMAKPAEAPPKPNLLKSILARPIGAMGKRQLLGVSSNSGLLGGLDGSKAGGFTAPRLNSSSSVL